MDDTDLPDATSSSENGGGGSFLNRLIAISALLTSMVSIFLGIQNSGSMNRLVEANSWPHLSVQSSNYVDGVLMIEVKVTNQGVGPALLHDFVVLHEGQPVGNAIRLVEACCMGEREAFEDYDDYQDYVKALGTYSPNGLVIRPGDEVLVFVLKQVEGNEDLWDRMNAIRFGPMTFKGCYCSVFDECWETDFESFEKTPVESCAISEDAWQG